MKNPIVEAFYRIEDEVYLVHMDTEGKFVGMVLVQQQVPEEWVTCSKESVLAFVKSQIRKGL